MAVRLDDGFQTLVQITDVDDLTVNDVDLVGEYAGSLYFWEKRVKPPGMVGGGPNDTTTMRNVRWRTQNSKYLITLSEMTMTVAYDPESYDVVVGLVQVPAVVDILWPDLSFLSFMGFLDEFNPGEITEGAQPEADITIVPTNQYFDGTELAPVYTAPGGQLPDWTPYP
jgi:hypothetical protein